MRDSKTHIEVVYEGGIEQAIEIYLLSSGGAQGAYTWRPSFVNKIVAQDAG